MWEELGWPGVKAITEALKQVAYPHCFSIRLWKTYCEDEGVRALCEFLERNNTVMCLDLLDNKITPLGCEFLGRTLVQSNHCPPIRYLKLDHNNFGSEGVVNLMSGLKTNKFVEVLSLCYCGIDQTGARSLFEMLIYSQSKLVEMILTGNYLRNEGTKIILKGVSIAKELKKIYLADN
jgi:Ran GTPase-activating protein (RanGAP) involved in mRNA processing and transport